MELPTGMPADAPTTSVEMTTSADPARVWELICDPAHPVPWSPELVGAEWLDGGPALGAHFRGDNRRGDRHWSTISTITSFHEGRRFGWTVESLDQPVSSWTYELATSEAGTRVTYTCRLGPGESGLTAAHRRFPDRVEEITERRLADLRDAMETTLAGVIERAEAPWG